MDGFEDVDAGMITDDVKEYEKLELQASKNESIIVNTCKQIGIDLLPVDAYYIPRFRIHLPEVNFGALICKSLFIQKAYAGWMPDYLLRKK